MKRILIIGGLSNKHLIRLVKYSQKYNHDNYIIDGFSIYKNEDVEELKKIGYSNVYCFKLHLPSIFYKIKVLSILLKIIDCIISFNKIEYKYDLVNIHYIDLLCVSLYWNIRKKSKKLMITPWGSDVYRTPKLYFYFFKFLYTKADYVSLDIKTKFADDVIQKYSVLRNKIVNLDFGSSMIDIILENNTSKKEAKHILGLDNKYVVVCGYNANSNQRHNFFIDEMIRLKSKLPENIFFLFLMTYNEDKIGYIDNIEKKLYISGFLYKIYRNYLEDNQLLLIQKSTDLFIHIQTTDAYSATIQENILCGNTIINGKWLSYPDLEKDGEPYFVLDDVNNVGMKVLDIINNNRTSPAKSSVYKHISKRAWSYWGKQWADFYSCK